MKLEPGAIFNLFEGANNSAQPSDWAAKRKQTQQSSYTKFHRAAIDGYVDMLCEASKREANLSCHYNGCTPTLLAAQHGQLDALRILVGRGGDPEKSCHDGSNALHLAAARNHLNCVSFLVNFGVNMWALDNELHTAKDIAAIKQRKQILDYLDQMMAKQSALNTKSVQKLKEKAKLGAEKRLDKLRKWQMRAIKQVEKDERYLARLSNNRRLLKAAHSISDIKLVGKDTGSTPGSSVYGSETGSSHSTSFSSGTCSTGGFSKSSSLANLMRLDFLSRARQPHSKGNKTPCGSSNNSVSLHSGCSASGGRYQRYQAASGRASSESKSSSRYGAVFAPVARRRLDQQVAGSAREQHSDASSAGKQSMSSCSKSTGLSRKLLLTQKALLSASSSALPEVRGGSASSPPSAAVDAAQTSAKRPSRVLLASQEPAGGPLGDAGSPSSCEQLCAGAMHINWPPAPALSRATNETELGGSPCNNSSGLDYAEACAQAALDEPKPGGQCPSFGAKSRQLAAGFDPQHRDESQHQLLTQCLSQLKLQHEAIASGAGPQDSETSLLKPSKVVAMSQQALEKGRRKQAGTPSAALSPELAGRATSQQKSSPAVVGCKASAKQRQPHRRPTLEAQQQLICPKSCSQQKAGANKSGRAQEAKLISHSADSIGSAGSFAHRNARLSESSSNSSSSSLPSSASSASDSTYCGYNSSSSAAISANNRGPHSSAYTHPFAALKSPETTRPSACSRHSGSQSQASLDCFLSANNLLELSPVFADEKIDLEALLLLSECDLRSLNILLGPRRKLLKAIADLRRTKAGKLTPPYLMVDTEL